MCLMIILKVTKNQGFNPSLKNSVSKKPQGGHPTPPMPHPQPLKKIRDCTCICGCFNSSVNHICSVSIQLLNIDCFLDQLVTVYLAVISFLGVLFLGGESFICLKLCKKEFGRFLCKFCDWLSWYIVVGSFTVVVLASLVFIDLAPFILILQRFLRLGILDSRCSSRHLKSMIILPVE